MKRYGIVAVVLLCVAFSVSATEKIDSFDVVVRVETDGSLEVTEEIVYDFGNDQRHGIYRDIPVLYNDGIGKFSVRISRISVSNEDGEPLPFEKSRSGNYLTLKIGDPDVTISGAHTYAINYTVERALLFGETEDEVFWNATGSDWNVPITEVRAQVQLPTGFSRRELTAACFAGPFGSPNPCADLGLTALGNGTFHAAWFTADALQPNQGLTVRLSFPAGAISHPTVLQKILWFVTDNWPIAIPLVVLVIMFYLWWTRGRDPKGNDIIITQFEPPKGMSPGMVGTIYDENAHNKDISAELIELAILGNIKIASVEEKKLLRKKDDYVFYLIKSDGAELTSYQRLILEKLFGEHAEATDEYGATKKVKLSKLEDSFYKDLQSIKTEMYNQVLEQGYFVHRPQWVRTKGMVIGFGMAWLSFAFRGFLENTMLIIAMIISGIIIGIFGFLMPKRTYHGVLAKEHILGFREYLRVVEKDRLAFHNAPEKKPETFMQWLPYAMALGVEDEWAKQFEKMHIEPPNWYVGNAGLRFNSIHFAHAMSGMNANVSKVLSSRPGSSGGGGGFSGGGFGGGGGGSW